MAVEVVHWNPRLPVLPRRIVRHLPAWTHDPLSREVNNFGDLLGPLIVQHMGGGSSTAGSARRLLAVGSILHFARDGDVVWGTGINGNAEPSSYRFESLDVRAVRGPVTRTFLLSKGIDCPSVYGDPALLLPRLRPELRAASSSPRRSLTIIPNLRDWPRLPLWFRMRHRRHLLSPTAPLERCLRRIVQSDFVVSSSLHGLIVAEAFGIPCRPFSLGAEGPAKYEDYFAGTGRALPPLRLDPMEAARLPPLPALVWDERPLMEAFPADLFEPRP